MGELWAIILAAGESRRMGFPKMLLSFHGTTIIENVIANVTGSEVKNILVVLGAGSEPLVRLMEKLNVRYCHNSNYRDGMLSSVICGFRNIPGDHGAVLVFQGDQPLISPNAINTIIGAYVSSDKGLVIPVYKGKRGHPILIDKKYRDKIEKINPAKGLRSLAYKYSEDVKEVETNEPGILRDFDTYDEYLKEINQIK